MTGADHEDGWRTKSRQYDLYSAKGLVKAVLLLCGLHDVHFAAPEQAEAGLAVYNGKQLLGNLVEVSRKKLQGFDIRQTVHFVDFDLAALVKAAGKQKIVYREVGKFPAMQRDLAMVVARTATYEAMETVVQKLKLPKLKGMRLFDVFESDKLGADKKSVAINFTFADDEKTLTDKEVDGMMAALVQGFEKELNAAIRK
jgi:phenylalanyl-tRNA synthetase beta chain